MFAQLDKMLQTSHEIVKQSKEMLQQAGIDIKQMDAISKETKDEQSELSELDKKITPFKTQLKGDVKKAAASVLNVSWEVVQEAQKGAFNYSITDAYEAFMPGIQLVLDPLKNAIVKTLTKSWNLLTKLALSSLTYLGKLLLKPFAHFKEESKEKKKLTKENAQIHAIYQTITGLGSTLSLITELTGAQFEGIRSLTNLISNPQAAAIIATTYYKFVESKEKKPQIVTAALETAKNIMGKITTETKLQAVSEEKAEVLEEEQPESTTTAPTATSTTVAGVEGITKTVAGESQQKDVQRTKSPWKNVLDAIRRTQKIFSSTIKKTRTKTVRAVKGVFNTVVSPLAKVKKWAISSLAAIKRLPSIISSKIDSFEVKLKEASAERESISKENKKDEKEEECSMLKKIYGSAKKKLAMLMLAALGKVKSGVKSTTAVIKNFFRSIANKLLRKLVRPFRVMVKLLKRRFRRFITKLKLFGKTITKKILTSIKSAFKWAFKLVKKLAGETLSRIFETSGGQVAKRVLSRLLAPVLKVITRFLTRIAATALSTSGVGTALGVALFALDLKYDFSGKIVDWLIDQAINLPSTISNMMDGLKKFADGFKESLNDIGDSILDPIINVLDTIRTFTGAIAGGIYSVTVGPVVSMIGKIASVMGFDSIAKRIRMVNDAIKENIEYHPDNAPKTFGEKLMYIPNLIISPFKTIINIIKSAFQTDVTPEIQQNNNNKSNPNSFNVGAEFGGGESSGFSSTQQATPQAAPQPVPAQPAPQSSPQPTIAASKTESAPKATPVIASSGVVRAEETSKVPDTQKRVAKPAKPEKSEQEIKNLPNANPVVDKRERILDVANKEMLTVTIDGITYRVQDIEKLNLEQEIRLADNKNLSPAQRKALEGRVKQLEELRKRLREMQGLKEEKPKEQGPTPRAVPNTLKTQMSIAYDMRFTQAF